MSRRPSLDLSVSALLVKIQRESEHTIFFVEARQSESSKQVL